jgi:hypothetical protein
METAVKLKDPMRLQEVRRLCKDPALSAQIQEALAKM